MGLSWWTPFTCLAFVAAMALGAMPGCGGEVEPWGLAPSQPGVDSGMVVIGPSGPPEGGLLPDTGGPIGFVDAGDDDATDDDSGGGDDAEETDANPDAPEESGILDAGFDQSVPDGGWVVAAHYPMPTVVDFGGSVNATPVFTAVTFPGYDLETEAQQFVSTVGGTTYWTEVVAEYGVGPAVAMAPVVLSEPAPTNIDDTAIQTWLAGKLDGSAPNAAFGTPSSSSVYVIFYPTGTTVTLQGLESCVNGGFGGYHNSVQLTSGPWAGLSVSYAVVPECSFDATTAEDLTESGSHELIEATSDPLPETNNPAYVQTDENDIVWEIILGGGELADMCAQNPNAFFVAPGFTTPVQRSWSNAHALAGHDPCQPSAVGVTYFNAVAVMNAPVTLTYMGQGIPTQGLQIPLHASQTVEVDLYSDGPMGDWTVSANDLSQYLGSGPYLDFSWDRTTGTNGTKLHLTITPVAGGMFGGEPFEIVSASGSLENYWLGFVGQ